MKTTNFEFDLEYEEQIFEEMKKYFGFPMIVSHWNDPKIIGIIINYCAAMSEKNREKSKKYSNILKKEFEDIEKFYLSLKIDENTGELTSV